MVESAFRVPRSWLFGSGWLRVPRSGSGSGSRWTVPEKMLWGRISNMMCCRQRCSFGAGCHAGGWLAAGLLSGWLVAGLPAAGWPWLTLCCMAESRRADCLADWLAAAWLSDCWLGGWLLAGWLLGGWLQAGCLLTACWLANGWLASWLAGCLAGWMLGGWMLGGWLADCCWLGGCWLAGCWLADCWLGQSGIGPRRQWAIRHKAVGARCPRGTFPNR